MSEKFSNHRAEYFCCQKTFPHRNYVNSPYLHYAEPFPGQLAAKRAYLRCTVSSYNPTACVKMIYCFLID